MLIPALFRSEWPIALWCVALLGLGYMTGWLITRGASRRRVARDSELALARLREVAASVAEGVGNHAARVLELSSEVDATREDGDPSLNEIIRESLADVVLANEHLQDQLKGAHVKLERQAAEIEAQAAISRTDILTGLCNRYGFDDELNRRYAEWLRQERVCSLLMIDLGVLKTDNDRNGHRVGDDVLRAVGRLLRCIIREMDVAIRYDETVFAVILPGTSLPEAITAAERIRPMLVEPIYYMSGDNAEVSISMGVAQVLYEVGVTKFVARAEEAVAAAKSAGGNCTVFHDGKSCRPAEEAPSLTTSGDESLARVRASDAAHA